MNRLSKSLLTGSLAMLAVGVFVSFTGMLISPVWTIVLPYGVILFDLFLISFIFQKEFAKSDQGEQTESHPNQKRYIPSSAKDSRDEGSMAPHQPAYS
jgi:hypothetical protein